MRRLVLLVSAILIGYGLITIFGLRGSDPLLKQKLKVIKSELRQQGYQPLWIIISQKRSQWYNDLLSNSVKDSKHLKGKAIDIFVLDINGDWRYDQTDFDLIKNTSINVEVNNPAYEGKVYNYLKNKSPLSRRMVHLELR
jgi:hypothetical protein